MQCSFLAYQQIFGITLAIITISLDTRENILARPLSLVGTIVAFFVYYPAGLYAKCLQSVVTICLNIYGWYQWSYGGKHKTPLRVSKTSPLTLLRLLLAGVLGTVALGSLLYRYSQADLPYWDSLHTVMCLIAQWMLVRKKLESWFLWVLADVLYTAVLYHKGLYLFSGLYLFFTFLAINGYRTWRQSYLKQTAAAGTSEQDI